MAKNPNYNRYAGIESLPGDPLNPKKPRPFRVDEDGEVIYLDKANGGGDLVATGRSGSSAPSGILSWDDLDKAAERRLAKLGGEGAEPFLDTPRLLGNKVTGTRKRIGGVDYDVMSANAYDPLKSNKATAVPNEDLMATAIANQGQVAVRSGSNERGAYLVREPSELPWSDRIRIGRTKYGEDEPYLDVPIQDSYSSIPASHAKAGSTASASTLNFGDKRYWPKGTVAISHGHIETGPDRSNGMVDEAAPDDKLPYGDSVSLAIGEPMPQATVYKGKVGWHFIENGQLKFMYPSGAEGVDSRQLGLIQKNLDRAQNWYRDKSK